MPILYFLGGGGGSFKTYFLQKARAYDSFGSVNILTFGKNF